MAAPSYPSLVLANSSLLGRLSEPHFVIQSRRAARRGISLFLRLIQREIPRFARNDKMNYFSAVCLTYFPPVVAWVSPFAAAVTWAAVVHVFALAASFLAAVAAAENPAAFFLPRPSAADFVAADFAFPSAVDFPFPSGAVRSPSV